MGWIEKLKATTTTTDYLLWIGGGLLEKSLALLPGGSKRLMLMLLLMMIWTPFLSWSLKGKKKKNRKNYSKTSFNAFLMAFLFRVCCNIMNQNLGRTKFLGFKSKEQLVGKNFRSQNKSNKIRVNGTQSGHKKTTEKYKTKLRL